MKKQKETSTDYTTQAQQKIRCTLLCIIFLTVSVCSAWAGNGKHAENEYTFWKRVGIQAGFKAAEMIRIEQPGFHPHDCLVLTNAGYAEINGRATTGALDGLTGILEVGRGDHSLVELLTDATAPLWFAVYDKKSGYVAYLEVDPTAVTTDTFVKRITLFSTAVTEQINAEHLYAHATEYTEKFNNKIFNGNEFRIVTIANALSIGVPTTTVRAFELHDHYCPGVTSGVVMADYVKKYFPKEPGTRYFVQTIQPWCKEDALLVLLNATPGKKSYSVTYPTEEDLASRPEWAQNVSTIVYRDNTDSKLWEGIALSFDWGENTCPDYGHAVMNKLCKALQFVDSMDSPEQFVQIEKSFHLPRGVHPKEYARPGVDPVALLDSISAD